MHQNQWVVRSSGRILGPFSTDEMLRRLESRNISLIDEVAGPFSRWSYIREQPQFAGMVETLQKDSYSGKEDTKTATISGQTQTVTMIESDLESMREETGSGVKNVIATPVSAKKARPVKSYGDASVDSDSNWSAALWALAAVLIFGLLSYVFYFKDSSSHIVSSGSNWLQLGQIALELGQYDQAIEHFANAYKQTQDPDTALTYSALLISNNETVQAKRILDKLGTLGATTRRKVNILKGLAFLTDQDVGKAVSFFERDLKTPKGIFVPAAFNLGIANSMGGKYADADNAFRLATARIGKDEDTLPFANAADGLFFRAYNLALQYKRIQKTRNLRNAKAVLRESIKRGGRFRNESHLLLAWVNLKLGLTALAKTRVNSFLDSDPGLAGDHISSIFVYDHYVNWKALGWFCQDLVSSLPKTSRVTAAFALCEFKKGNYQFKKYIADATALSKNDGLVRAIESYLLLESGEMRRAETVLDMATGDSKAYFLPYLLKGESCWANSDTSCAYKNWLVAFNRNPNDIVAIVGLAKYFLSLGERSAKDGLLVNEDKNGNQMAKEYIRLGMKVSNNYKPLLLLKYEMEKF